MAFGVGQRGVGICFCVIGKDLDGDLFQWLPARFQDDVAFDHAIRGFFGGNLSGGGLRCEQGCQQGAKRKREKKLHPQPHSAKDLRIVLRPPLVQEVSPVKRISLHRFKPGVADNATQLFLGRAVGHARSSNHILFEHDRAYVVAAELQTKLADF